MLHAYFDNNANTAVLPEVLEAMLPALRGECGNASSIHQLGQSAKAALEQARSEVAALVQAPASNICFTSGGTESDNLAIRGLLGAWAEAHPQAPPAHLITTRIEHHAVLNVFEDLERAGHAVTWLRPDANGRVSAADVAAALRPDTALISVMMANNETGVLQPVAEIGALAREAKVAFHVDAIQAVGRVPVDVGAIGCGALSLSAHKIHGPSGVGALYLRRGARLQPQILGGHHERDHRAGTENLPGILGFGAAARLARQELETRAARYTRLRERLEEGVRRAIPDCLIAGADAARVPNTSDICFRRIEGEALVIALDLQGFCVSTGAACSSGALEPSHVLLAMGWPRAQARASLRFSFGARNTEAEVEALLEVLPTLVRKQRALALGASAAMEARSA
ncbi:MAG: cysteine desulfurase family protein [Terriglobales bacterium]